MKPFNTHNGTIVPLNIDNIDTDQIIPKQFLQAVTRCDFGKHLFFNWRYIDEQGTKNNPSFSLNNPSYKNASVLLTGSNFGCGSSREHAVWAIQDFGVSVVIAESFADIFYQNAINNGLLPVVLNSNVVKQLINQSESSVLHACVDLKRCEITIDGEQYSFKINDAHREMLIKGTDTIEQTLLSLTEIERFEKSARVWLQ